MAENLNPDEQLATEIQSWDWWWGPWRNRIRCGSCSGLMDVKAPCPVCAMDYSKRESVGSGGRDKGEIVAQVFQGALDWSPYVMLKLMHQDWCRPLSVEDDASLPATSRPSPRALIVLIFWTYFETLMTWYYEAATRRLPPAVAADLLTRYGSIGGRLDRLHRVLFQAKYGDDLDQLGFADIRAHLENLQERRNAFIHGTPEAIDDALVDDTARLMPRFHEAWIRSFNLRCTSEMQTKQA
jgi:hypothetical protein